MAGLPAAHGSEPGQVRKEAATAILCECRGLGSPPIFLVHFLVSNPYRDTVTQVLARKWRPRNFTQLVGQEHVVRALTNALRQQRLHHAYLFTGTRGVGKTTIARILAKSLNCEQGITDAPCGICSACTEIDTGRFVDLIELDAASNTQVDNMRELLENALYAPTSGRFKVYIIDEVHMLSRNAFNAMLKTLEEPPGHVKFILATTDPQKIPVTVLSRCLQFSLKQIPQLQIRDRLSTILESETITADVVSIALIARAAEGSLRDALSLLDQAIAHGGGQLDEESTRAMLGAVDQTYLFTVLDALAIQDGAALVAIVDVMAERSLSFEAALQGLGTLLHRLALAQIVPNAIADSDPDQVRILQLSQKFSAEEVQLYYQIANQGRAEIGLAPDEYAGFMMTLLRMLAFSPEGIATKPLGVQSEPAPYVKPVATIGAVAKPSVQQSGQQSMASADADPSAWNQLVSQLGLNAMAKQLALRCELVSRSAERVELRISASEERLFDQSTREKLIQALKQHMGAGVVVKFISGKSEGVSPKALTERKAAEAHKAAVVQIQQDSFVQELISDFGGAVDNSSIKSHLTQQEDKQ